MHVSNHLTVLVLATLVLACPAGHSSSADKLSDATRKLITVDLGEGVQIDFVQIPAGSFMMGSPEDEEGRGNDEGPQHRVTIAKPFYMGRFEVTNAQFRRFLPKHNSKWYTEYEKKFDLNGDDQPAVQIHWKHTEWFCEWLNERLDGNLKARLPSEAEWEYAARGGDDRLYPWGNDWPPPPGAGNFSDITLQTKIGKYWEAVPDYDDGFHVTAPVGSFEPNPYGLYDMAGNAWEWCQDTWHRDYTGAPSDGAAWDPDFVFAKKKLVPMRGGGWHSFRQPVLRTAYRGNIYFKYDSINKRAIGYDHTGFRVVLSGEK